MALALVTEFAIGGSATYCDITMPLQSPSRAPYIYANLLWKIKDEKEIIIKMERV